jgi:multiple sugar transport system permease protein
VTEPETPRSGGTESLPAAGPRRSRRSLFPYLAALPAVVLVLGIMVAPIVETVYHSFTAWNGQTSRFIGLENFRLLWHDQSMRTVALNSVIFLVAVPAIEAASLIAAVLIYEQVIGWRTFRVLFFIPAVLSPVVVGQVVSTFVLPGGLADLPLRILGLPSIDWLGSAWPARAVIMAALVWTSFGFGMLILLSGMTTIDHAIYEAAVIDGTSWWKRLWHITLPLVTEQLQFLAVVNVIYTFTALFTFVFVITGGGPGFTTTTIDYYTYVTTFENGEFGYGAALAVVLFVIVLGLTAAQFALFRRRDLH